VTAPVAVFGVGNRSRGDDAVGPLLLERLRGWLEARGLQGRFDLFEAYQLQVENALDLEGREVALFIDARQAAASGADFRRLDGAVTAVTCHSHMLEPGAVLAVHRQVTGREPPPAFALGVRAERFELGEGISDAAQAAMTEAWRLLETLAADPRPASWQAITSTRIREEEPWQQGRPP
jgi:hydrogenase maturation protease